jgi:hypothetical protein
MSTINKLKNTWISNDTTNLQGTYNKVSILNEGKTELKNDTLINTKLAINKNIDSGNDYKLDVAGNINFTGNLYKNNTLFSSGISLADVQTNANTFTNTNTFNNSTTFSGNIIQTNKNILQKAEVSNATTYNWTFGNSQIIILSANLENGVIPTINFNLPSVSTENLGTIIYIYLTGYSTININASSGFFYQDEGTVLVNTKSYNSFNYNHFTLIAKSTIFTQWAIINSQGVNKNIIPTLTDQQTFSSGLKSFNCPVNFQQLPTTAITTFDNNNFITKSFSDSTYYDKTYIDSLILNYYTKTQSDSNYYTKTQSDTNYYTKTQSDTNYYTKTQSDGLYQLISNMTNYYTKTQSDGLYQTISSMSNYGQLGVGNTWTLTNTFSRGIVPRRFAGNGTDYQISNNAMLNRQTGSVLNIGIGNETLAGDSNSLGWVNNTGSRNIALGHLALQNLDTGNDNIAIGYQALQTTGLTRVNGAGVTANRCIAIGTFSQRTNTFGQDNITIGYNSLLSNVSGGGNVIISSNGGGGLSNKNGCIIIGRNSCPTASENSIISIGDGAMGGATGATLACIAIGESALYNARSSGSIGIGYRALFNLTTGFDCQAWGYQAGQSAVTATYSQFIGRGADTTLSSVVNSVCMGYGAITTENFEFVIGGLASGDYPRLTIPNKTRLVCNQEYASGTTINLTFRSNENIVLSANTLTTLNLPSITGTENIGAKFHIYRSIQTSNSLLINASVGQSVDYVRSDGVYVNIPNGSSFPIYFNDPYAEIICVSTTKWLVLCRVLSQASNTVNISTNLVPGVNTYNIPFGVSGGTSTSTFTTLMNDTGLTYNTTSTQLTTPNLTATTSLTTNGSFIISGYRPYEIGSIAGNATALPGLPTIYGTYLWTASTTASTNTVITLPTITTNMVGYKLAFRRLTYSSTNTLIIKTPSGGATIMVKNNITSISANTNYTLLDTTTTITGTHAVLMADSTSRWIVLF